MSEYPHQAQGSPVGPKPRSLVNGRIDVLGVAISDTSPQDAIETVSYWIEHGHTEYVCVTPVSGVMAAQRDHRVMTTLNGAGMTVPDGMPIVWSGRWAGATQMSRVYGPDLMSDLCEKAAQEGWRSFFYGGKEGVAARVAERMKQNHPGLLVTGAESPPFRELTLAEVDAAASEIVASGANLVWVGLSTPRQDLLMARLIENLEAPVILLGVGAAFDIHAGLVRRPPDWMGPLGLWWLYRLLQEPKRLWRRYLVDNPQFAASILMRPPSRGLDPQVDGS